VQKHYVSKNMQGLQKEWSDKDVVWLSINSTSAQHGEYKNGAAMASWMRAHGSAQKALIDGSSKPDGRMAQTTPQMFVIDPAGKVVYNGAIDDKRSAIRLTSRRRPTPSASPDRHSPASRCSRRPRRRTAAASSTDLDRPAGPAGPDPGCSRGS
jgi:hypothetical protein